MAVASHVDVLRGTRDEPLITSAWEAVMAAAALGDLTELFPIN